MHNYVKIRKQALLILKYLADITLPEIGDTFNPLCLFLSILSSFCVYLMEASLYVLHWCKIHYCIHTLFYKRDFFAFRYWSTFLGFAHCTMADSNIGDSTSMMKGHYTSLQELE